MSSMVVTVTLNPCIDRTVWIAGFEYGGTNRVRKTRQDVCGKGINVSTALKNLGAETLCLGFNYAENAALLEQSLDEQGIAHDFVEVPGSLRMNLKLFDESRRVMTELNERGGAVDAAAVERLIGKTEQYLDQAELLVLSGSAPQGVPESIYGQLIRLAREKGVRTVLDASGALFREGLKEKPFLIKPNRDEFEEAFGTELSAGKSMAGIAQEIVAQGVEYVCVSLGDRGAMLACEEGVFLADAPDVEVQGVQGAGDSLVAGMCAALTGKYKPDAEALLRFAVAAAGASLMRPGTQMCLREDFCKLLKEVRIQKL